MSIKPVSDLYLISYEDGSPYKSTRDAKEAVDAIEAGFKVEEFVSLENHRAAMLQAGDAVRDLSTPVDPQVAEYEQNVMQAGNSPVIPDTWIPVSERMPEDEQEVLTINRMGHLFVSFFDKHSGLFFDRLDAPTACCIEHVLVTHWMPLPNPPKEVK